MDKSMYIVNNYQSKKTFSSFLSGVAGKLGVPIWGFYVNRGQLISSFGTRDKNGAILEFFPANAAYQYTNTIGFRTFIKINGQVYEFFNDANDNQNLAVSRHKVTIDETNESLKVKVTISYHILPNEKNGALVRKVIIDNLGEPRDIEVVDGLTQILPAGIDYGGYKSVSNLLQSWMQVDETDNYLFYKLRASTDDSSQVSSVNDGNYYFTTSDDAEINYIYDPKVIFGYDSTLKNPLAFKKNNLKDTLKGIQVAVNQVPSAYTAIDTKLDKKIEFISLIGYADDKESLSVLTNKYDYNYLDNKEDEIKVIHDDIVRIVETETSMPMFDEYVKQNVLDNVLRGGIPLVFKTKDGIRGYHIYSRKHGDLERDYNFFSIEPKYYSQGNGNFRDVLQNRRNDLILFPEIKDSNLIQFASLIQADGYNPLSIEGMKFKYVGNNDYDDNTSLVLKTEYTPGDLAEALENDNLAIESNLADIISNSLPVIKATFGEGYWNDHFTYLDDVIDSVESIYPDQINEWAFKNHAYLIFDSNVYVKPRDEKHFLINNEKVRQYNAIRHNDKDQGNWLKDLNGKEIKVNLAGKLLTLIANKYAILDPYGIGLSYEANKPGWNDAMNGLPGIFASGVSETIELLKLAKRTKRYFDFNNNEQVLLLKSTNEFIERLVSIKEIDDYNNWDLRSNELEKYRLELLGYNHQMNNYDVSDYLGFLDLVIDKLNEAIIKVSKIDDVIPTYLSYEVDKYVELDKVNEHGEKLVKALSFKIKPIANFLEAPARYIKTTDDVKSAKKLYENIKKTDLYDREFKFYKTSVDLTNESPEIGRIHAFTKGWLERESNFLHMTYKYLLGVLKAGLYDEFYEEIKSNYTCFMDPLVYGRSPLENSSFIAPSNNPDYRKQGQGFVARLSGSTAEFLSMWQYMFFGENIFRIKDGQLVFKLSPKLHKSFFKEGFASATLFSTIKVEIYNKDNLNTYDKLAKIEKVILEDNNITKEFNGSTVTGQWVEKIRRKSIDKIKIYFIKEEL